jgi:hypothetical protein
VPLRCDVAADAVRREGQHASRDPNEAEEAVDFHYILEGEGEGGGGGGGEGGGGGASGGGGDASASASASAPEAEVGVAAGDEGDDAADAADAANVRGKKDPAETEREAARAQRRDFASHYSAPEASWERAMTREMRARLLQSTLGAMVGLSTV